MTVLLGWKVVDASRHDPVLMVRKKADEAKCSRDESMDVYAPNGETQTASHLSSSNNQYNREL